MSAGAARFAERHRFAAGSLGLMGASCKGPPSLSLSLYPYIYIHIHVHIHVTAMYTYIYTCMPVGMVGATVKLKDSNWGHARDRHGFYAGII